MQELTANPMTNSNEESVIVLNSDNAEKLSLHSVIMKESTCNSFPYIMTINSSNFCNPEGQISETLKDSTETCKEDVYISSNEVCSDLKQVYFIIPQDDFTFTENQIKNECNKNFSNTPHIQGISLNTLPQNLTKESESLFLEIFDSNTCLSLAPSDKVLTENLDTNSDLNSLTFEDKISKRNWLLSKKLEDKCNAKEITCDKCNLVLYHKNNSDEIRQKELNLRYCIQCKDKFKTEYELQTHILQKHRGIKIFPCPHCIYSSKKLAALERHIRNKHHVEKKLTCKLCDKKFLRFYDLKLHLDIHLDLKNYICHLCGKQFNHCSNLHRHMRIHSKAKPYPCKVCGLRFSQVSSLFAHLITHTSGGSCPDCGAEYHSISSLKKHVKSVHKKMINTEDINNIFFDGSNARNLKVFYCKVCSEQFRFKKGLKVHESSFHSNKAIPCKTCLKIYPSLSDFKLHSCVQFKKVKDDNKGSKTRLLSYVCSKCDQLCSSHKASENHICFDKKVNMSTNSDNIGITIIEENVPDETLLIDINKEDISDSSGYNTFSTKNTSFSKTPSKIEYKEALYGEEKEFNIFNSNISSQEPHLELKQNRSQSKEFLPENLNEILSKKKCAKSPKFKCKYCTKEFSKKWNWSQHMGTHDLALRQYHCEHCMKSFSYRSTYQRHLKQHSENLIQELFPCQICHKNFKSKHILQQHVKRIHEKAKKYKCKLCPKEFFDKSDYNYHQRLHSGELLYMCCFCGKKLSHVSHLRRHERIHTGERPHKCPYCSKAFIQAVTLREHLRKHENGVNKDEIENITCIPSIVSNTEVRSSEKEFGIINLEEINVLSPYITGVHSDFAMYEGNVDSIN